MINNKVITFVTFSVDIGRGNLNDNSTIKREFYFYETGLRENLFTNVPLVVYSSIENITLPENRNSNNLKFNVFKCDDIEKEFPNFNYYRETYPKTKKDEIEIELFYYAPLVVLKMKKIIDVIKENPFSSNMFFWMDSYFTRGINDFSFLMEDEKFVNMYNVLSTKIGDKFLLFNFHSRPFGFFWGGTKIAIEKVYEEYFDIFFENLPNKIMAEELIFKKIYEKNPDLFHFVDISEYGQNYKEVVSKYITE